MSADSAIPTPVPNTPSASSSSSSLLRVLGCAVGLFVGVKIGVSLYHKRQHEQRQNEVPNRLIRIRRPLKHNYYMVRHGESTANVSGIISSDPAISTVTHGLTPLGRSQVSSRTSEWAHQLPATRPIFIVSSDFTRARETAEVVHHTLTSECARVVENGVILHTSLRERFFGDLNGGPSTGYEQVWAADAVSADHIESNVESVNDVVRRTTQLIMDIEESLEQIVMSQQEFAPSSASCAVSPPPASSSSPSSLPPASVILVAHGDVCQILATAFLQIDHRHHRSLPHWNNAEMRQLTIEEKKEEQTGMKA